MEEFELKGVWWLPEAPDIQIAGVLKFDPVDGAKLETIGDDFNEALSSVGDEEAFSLSKEIKLICGYCEFPKKDRPVSRIGRVSPWTVTMWTNLVTLFRCEEISPTFTRGYRSSVFLVHTVFLGKHYGQEDEITFDCMRVNYSFLDEWTAFNGFDADTFHIKNSEWIGKYTSPDAVQVKLDKLSLSIDSKLGYVSGGHQEIFLKATTFVEIRPDFKLHYGEYRNKYLWHIRNFLTLGTNRTITPSMEIGQNFSTDEQTGETRTENVYIFYRAKGANVPTKDFSLSDALFRLPDISASLEVCLNNWFQKAERLKPAFDLYFALYYSPFTYTDVEFLMLSQALEAYHRRMYGGTYLSEEDYEPVRHTLEKAIPTNLDKSHRDSLKSRIKYGYEYSFRKRIQLILTEILEPYSDIVNDIVGDINKFADVFIDTRNFLTHYSDDLESKVTTDTLGLFTLTQKVKLILQLCFMVELDLPPDTIRKIVSQNQLFNTGGVPFEAWLKE